MTIRQVKSGWQVNIQPGGRSGRRIRKTLPTKAEALAWERSIQAKAQESSGWVLPKKDTRKLSDLVTLWFDLHGMQLKRGQQTKQALMNLAVALGDPPANTIDASIFSDYRRRRLEGDLVPATETRNRDKGISTNSANREHAYLRAMFNELKRVGQWKGDNPIAAVRQFKVDERELSYLSTEEIQALLSALGASNEKDALLVTKVCLSTGVRWSEAESLRLVQIRGRKLQLSKTKSGKVRVIPISESLESELLEHFEQRHGSSGSKDSRFFCSCYGAFRNAIDRAGISLLDGQMTHVLRHTFASHFMMNGGNILTLQRVLGHSSLTMTMRYAHLAPDHLLEAAALNPLAKIGTAGDRA